MNKKEFLEETGNDIEQFLFDQNATIGVMLKLIIDGLKKNVASSEEVIEVLEDFADSLVMKSPEAALEFKKQIDESMMKVIDKDG